jgi:hypothetical protein
MDETRLQQNVISFGKPNSPSRTAWALVSRIDLNLLVILALPWVLLSTGANWIFDFVVGSGDIDPWIYSGFLLDLSAQLKRFPATYYGSRLSWIWPGHLPYALFPPVIAAYVLHMGVFYVAVVSLYLTLKHTVGKRAGLLCAVFMGGYGYFLWAVGWDYPDGAGLAYFLLTTAALTYAARQQRSWTWLMLSGAFCGAMIYSQLYLVFFTPALLLYYVVTNLEQRRYSLKLSSLFFACGFLTASVLLGGINRKLGGDFLFYAPSVKFAMALAGKPNPWKVPFHLWWKKATWLVLPTLTFLSSLAFLIVNWKRRAQRTIRFGILFQLCFLICASTSVFFEGKGTPVVEYFYYASFLIPTMFLAVGAQLAPLVENLNSRAFALVVSAAIAVSLLAYRASPVSQITLWLNSHAPFLVLVIALAISVVFFLTGVTAKVLTLALVSLALGFVNIANGYFRVSDPELAKRGFPAIVESVQTIWAAEPNGKVLLWYRLSEPMGNFYRAIASFNLWGFSIINERFPSLEQGTDSFQSPRPNAHLMLLSDDPNALQQADSVLGRMGLGIDLVSEKRIHEGTLSWSMFFMKLHSWPVIGNIALGSNGWPESIELESNLQERQTASLIGPRVHQLFRSDMNSIGEWQVNRYGRSGGLNIQPNCLAIADSCGLYSSGDPRDHLASPFASLAAARPAHVFFSIWVKPLQARVNPQIVLQNEHAVNVAESEQLSTREDGWVLDGGWLDVREGQQLRLVVMQPPGSASLLDKALLLELRDELPHPAAHSPGLASK